MKLTAEFTFIKAVGGKKEKPEGTSHWCRVTLITEDTHDIFELYAASDVASSVWEKAMAIPYNSKVLACLDVAPMFNNPGYRLSISDIEVI